MKTVHAVVVAVLALGFTATCHAKSSTASGSAALSAKASIDFAIRIPRVARLRQLDTPTAVEITAEDIARGFVRVKARLELVVNDPRGYVLAGRIGDRAFSGFRMEGLGMPVEAPGRASVIPMPPNRRLREPMPVEVSYELRLAEDAMPGVRPWPLRLEVQAD